MRRPWLGGRGGRGERRGMCEGGVKGGETDILVEEDRGGWKGMEWRTKGGSSVFMDETSLLKLLCCF